MPETIAAYNISENFQEKNIFYKNMDLKYPGFFCFFLIGAHCGRFNNDFAKIKKKSHLLEHTIQLLPDQGLISGYVIH